MDIYIYDENFERINFVDNYSSIIWANRYRENGDCEIYLPATEEALDLYQEGRFLVRDEDDMICRINRVEIQTDAENGDYLTVSGIDLKSVLDQRIVWETQRTTSATNTVEKFIRRMIYDNLGEGADLDRRIMIGQRGITLGTLRNFPEKSTEQVSYKNIGEYMREYCEEYGRGYRLVFYSNTFYINIFEGTDRTDSVVFSRFMETLDTSDYIHDNSNLGNVSLIGGEGQGAKRVKIQAGEATGIDRYEIFTDADGESRTISWDDFVVLYPLLGTGGDGIVEHMPSPYTGREMYWYVSSASIQIFDKQQLAELEQMFPDAEIVEDGGAYYYQPTDRIIVAQLPDYKSNGGPDSDGVPDPEDETGDAVLEEIVYKPYLLNAGYTELGEYGAETSFECKALPDSTYKFHTDYFLGDKVTVDNGHGIKVEARITEVIESDDENGYNIELTLEKEKEQTETFIPPFPPINVSATAGTGKITVNWSDAEQSYMFEVYRASGSTEPEFTSYGYIGSTSVDDPPYTTYVDNTTTAGTVYWYKVRTVTEDGVKSTFSEVAHATAR